MELSGLLKIDPRWGLVAALLKNMFDFNSGKFFDTISGSIVFFVSVFTLVLVLMRVGIDRCQGNTTSRFAEKNCNLAFIALFLPIYAMYFAGKLP